ncbi:MAG: alpha/beta fold hydrolase [Streptosporangiales bacterium]|nr:alpha/beta fold hydrolase [Streptosporangiales bacterium]
MTEAKSYTLDVPGAVVTYDVRESEPPGGPVLMLVGQPMGASGFQALGAYFPDRTVVTYDPRGTSRSRLTEPVSQIEVRQHADDLYRIITELGRGAVDIFGSSGGAVTSLELVARHPEAVRTLVAHEPPSIKVLPDAEALAAVMADLRDTYQRDGFGAGMAKFIAFTSVKGEVPADFASRPAPDPAMFGLPTEDDGTRDDSLLGLNIISIPGHEPDFEALRAAPTRIVIGAGRESEGEMAHRGGLGVAARLGQEAVIFPSHHGGFLDESSGYAGEPEAFAATLRQVLETP